jgi:diacylglycerol O-acyltransferase / wax synthase
VIVSNVAGPSWPFYLAGRDVESLAALGPIFDGVPLNLTAVSYQDRLSLAFVACPKLVPDLDALAGATEECLDDLVRAIALDL